MDLGGLDEKLREHQHGEEYVRSLERRRMGWRTDVEHKFELVDDLDFAKKLKLA